MKNVKEMAAAIQLVLGAPAELLSRERLGRLEALLHVNSGRLLFQAARLQLDVRRWRLECRQVRIVPSVRKWAAALQAAMRDAEFCSMKPESRASIGTVSAHGPVCF